MADPLDPLYVLVGSSVLLQLGNAVVSGVKYLGARAVEREDRDKDALTKRLDTHDTRFEDQDEGLAALDRLLTTLSSDNKNHHASVEVMRASLQEIKAHVEMRFDKQAESHRAQIKEVVATVTEKLEALEYQLRSDTTRAIHDAAQIRASKKKT